MKKIILLIRDKFKIVFKGERDKIQNRTFEPLLATFLGPQGPSFLDKKSRVIFLSMTSYLTENVLIHIDLKLCLG